MIGKVAGSLGSVAHEMGREEKVKPFLEDILFIDKSYQILEFFAGNGNAKKCVFPSTVSRITLPPFSPTHLPPPPSSHGLEGPGIQSRSITCGEGSRLLSVPRESALAARAVSLTREPHEISKSPFVLTSAGNHLSRRAVSGKNAPEN